jgi:hypothetical protein
MFCRTARNARSCSARPKWVLSAGYARIPEPVRSPISYRRQRVTAGGSFGSMRRAKSAQSFQRASIEQQLLPGGKRCRLECIDLSVAETVKHVVVCYESHPPGICAADSEDNSGNFGHGVALHSVRDNAIVHLDRDSYAGSHEPRDPVQLCISKRSDE